MKDSKAIAILAAGSYIGGPVAAHLQKAGYTIVAIVRPSTDTSGIETMVDTIQRGDVFDATFVKEATKGCYAILNFICQLMPPKDTIGEQMKNDLPPVMNALEAALEHDCIFIHTSGNFSIPTAGLVANEEDDDAIWITNQLPRKPTDASMYKDESWSTFAHEGGMDSVAALAEAKHRQDHAVADFIQQNPKSKARVIIPAGIYGPGLGAKFSFWDLAANLYLQGQFVDFKHAFVHIEDVCRVYQAVMEKGEPGVRYPVYGESMTVREFVQRYAKICDVPMKEDGPICSKEEAQRVYDDSITREKFDISYNHTLDSSLADSIQHLKDHNLLMVTNQAE